MNPDTFNQELTLLVDIPESMSNVWIAENEDVMIIDENSIMVNISPNEEVVINVSGE